jgi:phage-related baseplate assembly protein
LQFTHTGSFYNASWNIDIFATVTGRCEPKATFCVVKLNGRLSGFERGTVITVATAVTTTVATAVTTTVTAAVTTTVTAAIATAIAATITATVTTVTTAESTTVTTAESTTITAVTTKAARTRRAGWRFFAKF